MSKTEATPQARRTDQSAEPVTQLRREAPSKRSRWRRPLLVVGPALAVAIAVGTYFLGGRYVSEENAYVGATTVSIAAQVSGQVAFVGVKQNEKVASQDVVLAIDSEPYRIAADGARAQLQMAHDQISAQIETYKARQQQLEQARANLTYARQQLSRAQDLLRRGAGTQAAFDVANRDEQAAAAAVASAGAEAQAALAQIGGGGDLPIEQRPQYLTAKANLEAA